MNTNELLDLINQFKWDENDCPENNLADLLAMVNYKNPELDSIYFHESSQSICIKTSDYAPYGRIGESYEFNFNLFSYKNILLDLRSYSRIDMNDIKTANSRLLKLSINDIREYVMIPPDVFKGGIRYMIEKMVTSFMDKWSLFNRFMTKDEAIEEFKILNNRFDFIDTINYHKFRGLPFQLSSSKYKDLFIDYKTNMCDEDFSVTLEN
jgi:hypothetical protein